MSEYIFSLSDVSIADNSPTVTVNNSDSFFGLISGSQLFIVGKLPVTVIEHDTVTRTLTLKSNWTQGEVNNVSAQVVPIGAVSTLLAAVENNRAAYNALTEAIKNPAAELQPIVEDALRYLNTQVAQSPPVNQNPSLTHILSDYPTLKKTVDIPTQSPNNKREMLFDDVRGLVHVSLTDRWVTIPTTIASRKFAIFYRGLILRFKNAQDYTGAITMRVYPMGTGGLGLPNNPTLANHQWHTITENVTELYKIGEFGGEYFEGIIEYIELDGGWLTLDNDQSDCSAINASFDAAFGELRSPYRTFYQRDDGYWYSDDITPEIPYSMGGSWTQDPNFHRVYSVSNASDGDDALRFFNDNYDDYSLEVVLIVHSMVRNMAVTIANSAPNIVYGAGPARFLVDQERIYFKRQNGGSAITGSLSVESIRMRIPVYES